MRWSHLSLRRLATMAGSQPRSDIRRITRFALTTVVVSNLAGAGAILAVGMAHASHPEIPIIELH